jgi:hypothetical protein
LALSLSQGGNANVASEAERVKLVASAEEAERGLEDKVEKAADAADVAEQAVPGTDPVAAPVLPSAPLPIQGIDLPLSADEALLDGRRRPGEQGDDLPEPVRQNNVGALRAPPPEAFPTDPDFPLPDRWRLSEGLKLTVGADGLFRKTRFLDPYHQNTYKGDRPLCIPPKDDEELEAYQAARLSAGLKKCKTPRFLGLDGDDWFLALSATSDTIIEPRSFPIPVGVQTTERPGSNDVFGRSHSEVFAHTLLFGGSLIKGFTTYKPPEVEYRAIFALQTVYVDVPERRVLHVQPTRKSHRFDYFLGVQELFVDYHIRNVSDRYDFDSVRVGIQPFQADFRGFLFNDQQLGVRFFGNRDNNRYQYNLAFFWRLEKDSNTGLNSVFKSPRDDFVFFANLYRQDFPVVGMTSQISATVNFNREGDEIYADTNGFPVRPALLGTLRSRSYDVAYLGYSMDGHWGRLNWTSSSYLALGEDRNSFFTDRKAKIRSFFFAAEPSYDLNWVRLRGSFLYASGDKNPYDNKETGYDAIFENPVFAGADTSYWIRQTIPFAGGGRAVAVNSRNGVLANLRPSKEEGQSNFNNPGTILAGVGADFDITPKLRISTSVNKLWFQNTNVIQALRVEGSIPRSIGTDISVSAIYRHKAIQNLVFRLSGAVLDSGKGFQDLFGSAGRDKRFYSVLFNATLSY